MKSAFQPLEKVLLTLLLFVALNAAGGGIYGMLGAKEIPLSWLDGSPFENYFLPSLFLFFGVGGLSLLAAVAVFRRASFAKSLSRAAGTMLVLWILAQVWTIGWVSWLQPFMALVGIAIVSMSLKVFR